MSDSRRIFKNILSLSTAEFFGKGLTIVFTIYLARVLQPETYGTFSFAKTYFSYFVLLVTLGFESYGTREIAKQPDLRSKYVDAIFSLRLILSFFVYLFLALSLFITSRGFDSDILILIGGSQIFSIATNLQWYYQGIEKMEIIAIRQFLTGTLNIIGVIIFVTSPEDRYLAMAVISLTMFINSLWMIIYYIRTNTKINIHIDIAFWKKTLKSSIPIGAAFVFVVIYNYIAIIMLGYLKDDTQVGIYAAAIQIVVFGMLPLQIIQGAFFPKISRLVTPQEKDKILSVFNQLLYLVGVYISFSLFFYSDWITEILGEKYSLSINVIKYLIPFNLLVPLSLSYFITLIAWNREKQVFWANLAGAVINVSANILLIPEYGIFGAAIAMFCSELTVMIILGIMYLKAVKKTYAFRYVRALLIGLISFGPCYLLIESGINSFAIFIVSSALYMTITFISKTLNLNELRQYLRK